MGSRMLNAVVLAVLGAFIGAMVLPSFAWGEGIAMAQSIGLLGGALIGGATGALMADAAE